MKNLNLNMFVIQTMQKAKDERTRYVKEIEQKLEAKRLIEQEWLNDLDFVFLEKYGQDQQVMDAYYKILSHYIIESA